MTVAIDQETELAYDQAKWAANMPEVLARYAWLSETARTALGAPRRFVYGPAATEAVEAFRTGRDNAPVVVFVHGGGWRGGAASDYAFPAETLLARGIHYVAVDFSTVTDAGGELSVLIDQIRRALVWTYRNCRAFGGDRTRIFLAGHSSGAHLAAMALSTKWSDHGLPEAPIKGGFLVSGIYDLEPLRRTSRAAYVKLDDSIVRAASPIHHVAALSANVIVAVGGKESPEFQRQARAYGEAARQAGKTVRTVALPHYNHFEITETLGSPTGALGRELIGMIEA